MKNDKQVTEIVDQFTLELIQCSSPEAVIQFGSSVNGDSWAKSDVDLFVISKKARGQTGFYVERQGVIFHGNVISPKALREKLNNPAKLSFHSLFAGCRVLYDRTNWIKKEKLRLSKYPKENRMYQVMERLEAVLYQIYRMKKNYALCGETAVVLELPTSTLAKIFEVKRIHEGIYFGKSLIGKLSSNEVKKVRRLEKINLKAQISMLENLVSPWVSKYLPIWIKKVCSQKWPLSFEELNQRLIIDAFHIYTEARARGWVQFSEATRATHGFKINEWVVGPGQSKHILR